MERFGRVLRRVDRRLEAPEPERSRILTELAGDLEDLYRAYRERGLEEAEAIREAEKWLSPSAEALASLRSLHLPAFERLLDRLSGTTRGRVELGLVTLVSLMAVGSAVVAVLRSGTLSASSIGLWLVAGLVAAGLGIGVSQGYALFVRGDQLRGGWRRRSRRVLAAAVGSAMAGLLAGGVRLTLTTAPPEAGSTSSAFWSEVSTASGVAALGLSGSLLLALLWLVLRVRAEVVARARTHLRETLDRLDGEGRDGERRDGSGGRDSARRDRARWDR